MASTSETGHPKNVANFENLISFCAGYGTKYNPSKTNIQLSALQTQLASCKANIASVTTTSVDFNNAENARIIAFKDLKKTSTRLLNALDATDASSQAVKDFKIVNAKVQGTKSTKADAGKTIDPNTPVVETPKTISSSQQSYTNLIEHFAKAITILSTEPAYVPNETELQVGTLNAKLTNLKNTNTNIINAYTTVSNARVSRDQSLYNTTNGLCQTAKDVKMYIKSVFGASSLEYKQVSGIEFKARKI